jgi:hypothetical protein
MKIVSTMATDAQNFCRPGYNPSVKSNVHASCISLDGVQMLLFV